MRKRLKVITSYAGHARFLAECEEAAIGWIPRQAIEPYASGPTKAVLLHETLGPVYIEETRHKRYEVCSAVGIGLVAEDWYPATREAADAFWGALRDQQAAGSAR